jgi:hypothetical protein
VTNCAPYPRVHHDRRRLRLVEAVRFAAERGGVATTNTHATVANRGRRSSFTFCADLRLGRRVQNPDPGWPEKPGPKYTWLQETRQLIDGEPLGAFARAAMAGDVSAAIANWGTHALEFINVDYTLTLSRLPEEPHIGLASLTHYSHDGVATGSAVLIDRNGAVGNCVSVSIAHSAFRAPPAAPANTSQ